MLRLAVRVGSALCLALSAGCSLFQVGESDFSCPGMPGDALCQSTRDIYAMTDNGEVPLRMNPAGEVERPAGAPTAGSPRLPGAAENPQDVVSTFVTPRLPDQPVPVRTPAQVMRVWIAPWEDKDGDLVVTGYVYTEIQPRRWVLGEEAPMAAPRLKALAPVDGSAAGVSTGKPNATKGD